MNLKTLQNLLTKSIFLLAIMMSFFACQDEITEITPPNDQETITQGSSLANLMRNTAMQDGSIDNIIDNANCILVNLPVTVFANGVEIIIDSEADYDVIEAIFDEFDNDEDDIQILFPITISLNDYTQVEILNLDELEDFIEDCAGENEDDDDIECIDFQYPISISIYDANFQITETVTIENDEALYNFIENLEGGVLASLNFPVTMILSDGSTLEVNSNEELELVISEAEDDCDEDDDNDWNDDDEYNCSLEDITVNLEECIWNVVNLNGSNDLIIFDLDFNTDNSLIITGDGQTITAQWATTETEDGVWVSLDGINSANIQAIVGNWLVVECDDDRLQMEMPSTGSLLVIERDCDIQTNPFECFESFDAVLEVCDDNNDGFAVFNLPIVFDNCLNPNELAVTYHLTQADADTAINAIANPQAFVNNTNPQTIYTRVELVSNASAYQVFEISLIVNICGPGCDSAQVEAYLQTCVWNVTAYSGTDDLSNYDLQFNENDELILTQGTNTYTGVWNVNDNNGTPTIVLNIPAPNIQALSGTWELVECDEDRLQFTSAANTFVIEQDCTASNACDLNEVETNLMDCEWTISSYNNDTSFNIFNIDFMGGGNAVIASTSETYTSNWMLSLDGDIYLDFSNISGGNVQVLEGNFVLVECTAEQLIFHDPSDSSIELVLDKDCN